YDYLVYMYLSGQAKCGGDLRRWLKSFVESLRADLITTEVLEAFESAYSVLAQMVPEYAYSQSEYESSLRVHAKLRERPFSNVRRKVNPDMLWQLHDDTE